MRKTKTKMQKDKNKKGKSDAVFYLVFCILLAIFLFSSYKLITDLLKSEKEKKGFEELAAIVAANRNSSNNKQQDPSASEPSDGQDENQGPLQQYLPLFEMNPDFFGWLYIEDTVIDYPVMYTPDRPEYYLHRAFDGSYSDSVFLL